MILKKRIKKIVIKIVVICRGRALQSAAKSDPQVMGELRRWDKSLIILMQVLPKGPGMILSKQGRELRYLGSTQKQADLVINFKNIECAFPVMAGFMSAETGFAQNRMTVKGDIPLAMSLIRCINRILTFLFPGFISRRILKRVAPFTLKEQIIRLKILTLGIPFGH
ncbi:MAG: SCP2 sterol-binding domain-containing protein [Desulfobacula sp.]|nr:SCP2 sterol-binding domain-containing protein [Desulfobacula sp.]